VPLLGPDDPLPHRPRRILVAGTAGAGKTTLAARIAVALAVPHVEIDALFHGPGWAPRPTFADDVHRFTGDPAWATEWQYGAVRDHLAARADLLVWLDLPRWLVTVRVVRRTLVRRLRRQELWNGNLEPPLRSFLTDDEHIVRWAWRTHPGTARDVARVLARQPDLTVVRLRDRGAVARWSSGPLVRAAAGRLGR